MRCNAEMNTDGGDKSCFRNKLKRQMGIAGIYTIQPGSDGNLPPFPGFAADRNAILVDLGEQISENSDIRTIMMVSPKNGRELEDITNAELLAAVGNLFCKCEDGSCALRNAMLWNNGDLEADFDSPAIRSVGYRFARPDKTIPQRGI